MGLLLSNIQGRGDFLLVQRTEKQKLSWCKLVETRIFMTMENWCGRIFTGQFTLLFLPGAAKSALACVELTEAEAAHRSLTSSA
jgi:hypothetical protein